MFTYRRTKPSVFTETLYFKRLNSLLKNTKLLSFLKSENVKVYFVMHHALKDISHVSLDIDVDGVEVIDTANISQYIRQASLLLTDFSSVSFDFMFQDKPVILYGLDRGDTLMDKEEYRDLELLYNKRNTFPNVVFDEKEVVELVKYYVKNDFHLEEDVKRTYDSFFFTKENIRAKLIDEIEKACQK